MISMVSALSSWPTNLEAALHARVLSIVEDMPEMALCLRDIIGATVSYLQCSLVREAPEDD